MSLQQVTLSSKGSEGIRKEINKNSIDIVFDILQVYAYSMPVESTVRELTSNAVDSQREKEIAIEILTGKKSEEDYFIVKHGKEFEDSKFKREYYNLEYLDTEHADVELEYIEKPGSGFCDEFHVKDHGVGVGNGRMNGCLSLGFSTKRATKEQIGGYGLGGKSPLSTMTPFYTMISAYNGQLFKLNIYSKKVDDLIGEFNYDTGETNEYIVLGLDSQGNEIKLYYEKTDSKNYTEIITPVKKLNKHKYIDAVSSQLLYLPNVRFYVTDEAGYRREQDFKARVLYNSENIIISNNSRYSRPHLVVVKDKSSNVGICYNEINYKELELEQRYGQVGLKVQMRAVGKDENGDEYLINEGVTVTPNREQVIWNDDTKNYLLSITRNVANEAAEIVNKELVEPDFLEWIRKASTVLTSIRHGSSLYELAQMIDRSNIVPAFSQDKTIKFKTANEMFWGMYPRTITYRQEFVRATSSYVKKVSRSVVENWAGIASLPVYVKLGDEKASNVKDQYILQTQLQDQMSGYQQFVLLELNDLDAQLDEMLSKTSADKKEDVESKFNNKRDKMNRILEFIKTSKLYRDYDALVVPEDFKASAEEAEAKVEEIIAKETASLDELRKANGEIVFFTARCYNSDYNADLVWDKVEEKTTSILSWSSKTYYGFQEDSDMIKCACRVLGRERDDWYNTKIRIVKIARKNEKHFKAIGSHVSNFFYQLSDDKITMDDEVKKYYTSRLVTKQVTENHDLDFLKHYEPIDKRISDLYAYLLKEGEKFQHTLKLRAKDGTDAETQLFEQLTKYGDFQIFVSEHSDDTEAIATKSKELFGTDLLKNAEILDLTIVKQVELLKEYAEPIKELFNQIKFFKPGSYENKPDITPTAERQLRLILESVGLDKFDMPDELLVEKSEEKVAKDE